MNIVAILAGGIGSRMGSTFPKQFIEYKGAPIIVKTIEAFESHPEIDEIYIVCVESHISLLKKILGKYNFTKIKEILPGGADRKESSFIATEEIYKTHNEEDILLIHDAARPNVSESIISENIRIASRFGAVNTVINSQDTVLESEDGQRISGYLNRRNIRLVQTPQTFKLGIIYKAHLHGRNLSDITDDALLVLADGHDVYLAEGSKENVKITTIEDLEN